MGLRLLIADDEDTIRNGMYCYLKMHTQRYDEIYTAADGEETMEQLRLRSPDVMLLDISLPHKSGIQILKEASGQGILPVTLIMGRDSELQYKETLDRFGVRGYLTTPFRAQDVLELLLQIADELEQKKKGNAGKKKEQSGGVARVKEDLELHSADDITLSAAAGIAGVSPGYLSMVFSERFGCGFSEYLNRVRVENACTFLREGGMKMYEIAFRVGFRDEKYFSRVFRKFMGVSPSEYRRSQKK